MSDNDNTLKSAALGSPMGSSVLSGRLEESARLTRFFGKLVGESLHMQADGIFFALGSDTVTVTLRREKTDLKTISIKPSWFSPIAGWLADRFLVLTDEPRHDAWKINRDSAEYDFSSCIPVGEQIVLCRVKSLKQPGNKNCFALSDFKSVPRSQALERLGLSGSSQFLYDQIVGAESGIVIVAAPDTEQLQRNRAVLLALTGIGYAGDVTDSSIRSDLPRVSKNEPVLLSARADDATDALLKLKEVGIDVRASKVSGAICQGFIRKTCPACARKASVDKKLIALLPPALSPASWGSYLVGRGCESCGQRGQIGAVGVQSLVYVNDELKTVLDESSDQEALLKVAYPAGTRSLLEDGLQKVASGVATLEALLELTKYLSPAYNFVLEEKAARANAHAATSGDENAPLFSSGNAGKRRQKPLLLVVEDDHDQRSILDMVFKASNYDVILATNGKEALEKLKSNIPDLIVTDLMMPEMDGVELVSKLKADSVFKKIPILILTVISDGDKEYALLDLGADDYCEKTVQRKILLKRIENLLKRSKSA
jgi:CheY-like chemotaxis protein